MAYRSIRKLSYELKPGELQTVYEQRLNSDPTIRLSFPIHGNPAFIVLDSDMLNLIASIYRTNTNLLQLQGRVPGIAVQQYQRSILIDEIGLTNELENIHSTRREIEESLESTRKPHKGQNPRFAGMIQKYDRLLSGEFVSFITCMDVRELYNDIALPEVLIEDPENAPDGVIFRKDPVSVRNKHDLKLHEGVFPESAIIEAMGQALVFLNDDSVNMLLRIAAFHYMFGYIHPFYDGNGRTSRFISSTLLAQELCPLVAFRLSTVIKNERAKYYRLFRDTNEVRNRGDLTDFVRGFLEFILDALQDAFDSLSESWRLLDHFVTMLEDCSFDLNRHPVLWTLIQNALFSQSGLSMEDLTSLMGKNRKTVEKELNIYKEWNVLRLSTEGRRIIYQLDPQALTEYLADKHPDQT